MVKAGGGAAYFKFCDRADSHRDQEPEFIGERCEIFMGLLRIDLYTSKATKTAPLEETYRGAAVAERRMGRVDVRRQDALH